CEDVDEKTDLDTLLKSSDIVTLHCPLTKDTHHLIDSAALAAMKPTALLINNSRGPLIDTGAVIKALKGGQIGGLAIDVYEQEKGLFFVDRSGDVLQDDLWSRLITFPNVIMSAHMSFLTHE